MIARCDFWVAAGFRVPNPAMLAAWGAVRLLAPTGAPALAALRAPWCRYGRHRRLCAHQANHHATH